MAVGMRHLSIICFVFGGAACILGVIAENIKPAAGTPVQGKGVIICKFSGAANRFVIYGFVSLGFHVFSTIVGCYALSYPYNNKAIPRSVLYASSTMNVFFFITWIWVLLGGALTLWPTVVELLHHIHSVHKDMSYACPTAKTGVLGGGALVMLSSSFFWLVCIMLAKNARDDFFDEMEEAREGEKTRVIDVDYDALPAQ